MENWSCHSRVNVYVNVNFYVGCEICLLTNICATPFTLPFVPTILSIIQLDKGSNAKMQLRRGDKYISRDELWVLLLNKKVVTTI